jgi:hypothetical protein
LSGESDVDVLSDIFKFNQTFMDEDGKIPCPVKSQASIPYLVRAWKRLVSTSAQSFLVPRLWMSSKPANGDNREWLSAIMIQSFPEYYEETL